MCSLDRSGRWLLQATLNRVVSQTVSMHVAARHGKTDAITALEDRMKQVLEGVIKLDESAMSNARMRLVALNDEASQALVLGRTKAGSLAEVKNLNLWGQDITDVSILGRMPGVEVLSLSVNRIPTLRDFQGCLQLQELYLRKNEVGTLAEIV